MLYHSTTDKFMLCFSPPAFLFQMILKVLGLCYDHALWKWKHPQDFILSSDHRRLHQYILIPNQGHAGCQDVNEINHFFTFGFTEVSHFHVNQAQEIGNECCHPCSENARFKWPLPSWPLGAGEAVRTSATEKHNQKGDKRKEKWDRKADKVN